MAITTILDLAILHNFQFSVASTEFSLPELYSARLRMDAKIAPLHLNRKALHYKARQKQWQQKHVLRTAYSSQVCGNSYCILCLPLDFQLSHMEQAEIPKLAGSILSHTHSSIWAFSVISPTVLSIKCAGYYLYKFHKFFINVFTISKLQVPVSQQKLT